MVVSCAYTDCVNPPTDEYTALACSTLQQLTTWPWLFVASSAGIRTRDLSLSSLLAAAMPLYCNALTGVGWFDIHGCLSIELSKLLWTLLLFTLFSIFDCSLFDSFPFTN